MSPWLFRQFELLDQELATIVDPRKRIETLFKTMWGVIPHADNNLAINLVQGLALSDQSDNYSRDLLRFLEGRVTRALAECLPEDRRHILQNDDAFAHLAFMAFDGFVLGARLKGHSERLPYIVDMVTDFLMGAGPAQRDQIGKA
jgi:hypothetical protein